VPLVMVVVVMLVVGQRQWGHGRGRQGRGRQLHLHRGLLARQLPEEAGLATLVVSSAFRAAMSHRNGRTASHLDGLQCKGYLKYGEQ